jgi:hypothetical protein
MFEKTPFRQALTSSVLGEVGSDDEDQKCVRKDSSCNQDQSTGYRIVGSTGK